MSKRRLLKGSAQRVSMAATASRSPSEPYGVQGDPPTRYGHQFTCNVVVGGGVEEHQDGEDQRRAQQDDPAQCQAELTFFSSLLLLPWWGIPDYRKILFSPRAKKVLERALREAMRVRDNHLGTEHVLLGILRNEDGTAVRMLDRMGVSPEMLEQRLFELRGRAAS